MSSIVRVSELGQVTGVTPNSLFLTSYGESNPRQSKYITKQDLLGQYATTGSNTFHGDQFFSGSLNISGTTILGGNIVPLSPRGASLGTLELPFRDIFVSSGSINIASDVSGSPNTNISNNQGNLLISAGGLRLLGSASFVAQTGSFNYISGSLKQVGNYIRVGDTILNGNQSVTGSLQVSGSTIQIGNNTLLGNTTLSGSVAVSGSMDINGNLNILSGSGLYVAGQKQFNYGLFYSIQNQSGSANTAYAMKYSVNGVHNGISIVNNGSGFPTRITPQNSGLYNVQFSNQLGNTTNTNITFDVWFRLSETDIPNSNTKFSLIKSVGSGLYSVAALNFLTQINTGQYLEIMWSCDASTGVFETVGTQSTPTRPVTPSIILTVTQVA
jgi:hypothetical protein